MAVVITDVSPPRGALGTQITITGTGFSGANNSVTLGGVSQTIDTQSTTVITFTISGAVTKNFQRVLLVTNNDTAESDSIYFFVVKDDADIAVDFLEAQQPGPSEDPDTETATDAEAKDFERLAAMLEFVRRRLSSWVFAWRTASKTLGATNTWTPLEYTGGQTVFGDGISHDLVTNAEDFTINEDGYYEIEAWVNWRTASVSFAAVIRLTVDGTEIAGSHWSAIGPVASTDNEPIAARAIAQISAGGVLNVEIGVTNTSVVVNAYDDADVPDPTTTVVAGIKIKRIG